MEYTNQEILSAVLARWIQPCMTPDAVERFSSIIPSLSKLEAWAISAGLVSSEWSLGKELSPYLAGISEKVLTIAIHNQIKRLPEDDIPVIAHAFVENAEALGRIDLLEGLISFEAKDIVRLKVLLEKNLPITEADNYTVTE